ncbi:hypothetical protein [Microvirga mediterraneensis]|uniref:Uncharacterized protein n=1 Tax=Microvirga mediterraneensis TaxID=2754695 RepID=A0A838BHG8_9HYPH|nr:hypothetical protein [Microvirga mediterraneensis]MBA1154691.1 hypothetical protein [Microvirga mediterraneensis]
MAIVLVPVVAASLVGLIGMPVIRLMMSSAKTRHWARSRSMAQGRS